MKINLVIITGVIIMTLAGCSSEKKDTSQDTGLINLTVWAHEGQPAEKQALQKIFDAFSHSQQKIKVTVEFKQEQGYGDRVSAAAMARALPDILDVDGPYTAYFAKIGVLSPVDSFMTPELRNDVIPTILDQGTVKDSLYTLGAFDSTVVLYTNQSVMEECNITPPKAIDNAWTWDEFVLALRTIKQCRPDLIPLETFMGWTGEWLVYAFTPIVWSNDAELISDTNGLCEGYLNGPRAVEALSKWQSLFTEFLTDKNAPPGQFRDGKAAMAWGIFNRWPIYKENKINFGMSPLPKILQPKSPSGSWCWGITSACKEKEAAFEVIKWLVHPRDGVVPMCKANGGIPARKSAIELMPEYKQTRGLFIDQLTRSAETRPITHAYGTLTKELSRALDDIANGADVKSVLDRAVERIDMVLKSK